MSNLEHQRILCELADQGEKVVAGVVCVLEGNRELNQDGAEPALVRNGVQPFASKFLFFRLNGEIERRGWPASAGHVSESLKQLGRELKFRIDCRCLLAPVLAHVRADVPVKAGVDFAAVKELGQVFEWMDLSLFQVGRIDDPFPIWIRKARAAIVERRQMRVFQTINELKFRVAELQEGELSTLAEIGAFNQLNGGTHRRDALWQVARAAKYTGPLLREIEDDYEGSPLARMTIEERLIADYDGMGLTTGWHPMSYRRAELNAMKVTRAIDLSNKRNGTIVRIAGNVIVKQRPGTAKGLLFISLEDETGISRAVVMPDIFEKFRLPIMRDNYLLIEGELQNIDSVITVKAGQILPLEISPAATQSHDFY